MTTPCNRRRWRRWNGFSAGGGYSSSSSSSRRLTVTSSQCQCHAPPLTSFNEPYELITSRQNLVVGGLGGPGRALPSRGHNCQLGRGVALFTWSRVRTQYGGRPAGDCFMRTVWRNRHTAEIGWVAWQHTAAIWLRDISLAVVLLLRFAAHWCMCVCQQLFQQWHNVHAKYCKFVHL